MYFDAFGGSHNDDEAHDTAAESSPNFLAAESYTPSQTTDFCEHPEVMSFYNQLVVGDTVRVREAECHEVTCPKLACPFRGGQE